jgi:hypothetical protein
MACDLVILDLWKALDLSYRRNLAWRWSFCTCKIDNMVIDNQIQKLLISIGYQSNVIQVVQNRNMMNQPSPSESSVSNAKFPFHITDFDSRSVID